MAEQSSGPDTDELRNASDQLRDWSVDPLVHAKADWLYSTDIWGENIPGYNIHFQGVPITNIACYVYSSNYPGSVPLYRHYNPARNVHSLSLDGAYYPQNGFIPDG